MFLRKKKIQILVGMAFFIKKNNNNNKWMGIGMLNLKFVICIYCQIIFETENPTCSYFVEDDHKIIII